MQPKISIIVPVYKAEQHLHRCVDSILAQTFTDFELLLIDDGSPDNSGTICDEYAKKDNRVRVFHKENGGVSSARNLGLENAQGNWIAFIDADDYIHKDYLLSFSKNLDVDFIVGSFQIVGSNEKWNGVLENKYYDKTILKKDIVKLSFTLNFQVPWGKLFNRNIICNNNIVFDEKIHSGEDSLFVLTYLIYTSTLRLCNNTYYFYERGNADGLSQRLYNIEHHFYAINAFSSVLITFEKVFGSHTKQIYLSYMAIFCHKLIQSLYYSKDCLKRKCQILRMMSKNSHLKNLFLDRSLLFRKKVKLFHFIMSKNITIVSLLYIYILKGRIYY